MENKYKWPRTQAGFDVLFESLFKRLKYQDQAPWRSRQVVSQLLQRFALDEILYGVEVGTYRGHTAQVLLRVFPRLQLTCVDAWEAFISTNPDDQEGMNSAEKEARRRLRRFKDRVRINFSDVRDRHSMRYLVRGHELIFSLAGQVSHVDSMTDPATEWLEPSLLRTVSIRLTPRAAVRGAASSVVPPARMTFARPQSTTWTSPKLPTITFCGLRSRCMTRRTCA